MSVEEVDTAMAPSESIIRLRDGTNAVRGITYTTAVEAVARAAKAWMNQDNTPFPVTVFFDRSERVSRIVLATEEDIGLLEGRHIDEMDGIEPSESP
jgi:hypothetical protein